MKHFICTYTFVEWRVTEETEVTVAVSHDNEISMETNMAACKFPILRMLTGPESRSMDVQFTVSRIPGNGRQVCIGW